MGNTPTNSDTLADKFRNTCHPGLTECTYDPQEQLLWVVVRADQGMPEWRGDVDRLINKPHLFLPHRIASHEPSRQVGCCTMDELHRPDAQFKKIHYQPFVYTLEKQILTRRQKRTQFRQQQLWKLAGSISKACIEWQQTYPKQNVGFICPTNVVLNSLGAVQLVSRVSFFGHSYGTFRQYYLPPESSTLSTVKYALNPHCDPLAIEALAVYSTAAVLLDAATLAPGDEGAPSLQQKIGMLRGSHYSEQLKQTLMGMLQGKQTERLRLKDVVKAARTNRSKHF